MFRLRFMLVLLVAIISAATKLVTADEKESESFPKGHEFTFELVNTSDEFKQPLDAKSVTLKVKQVVIKEGDNLKTLLSRFGIFPDAEAFGVVYLLNPRLDPKELQPGMQLQLPTIESANPLKGVGENGHLVGLTTDPQLKKRVMHMATRVKSTYAKFSELPDNAFPSQKTARDTLGRANRLNLWFQTVRVEIQSKSRPLSPEMLVQIQGEAEVFESIMVKAQKLDGLLDSDVESLHQIYECMRIRMRTFNEAMGPGEPPPPCRNVLVSVRVVDPRSGKEVDNLRIRYVPVALYLKRKQYGKDFAQLSSPAEHSIPEANYKVWASIGDDARTDVVTLEARKKAGGNATKLDLRLKTN